MPLWLAPRPLVLASKSEVRRKVLTSAGLPVEIRPADVDERGIEAKAASKKPGDVAMLLSHAKAAAIAAKMPDRVVIGADQVLALGDRRFSKPKDRNEARDELKVLRGQTHALHSGVVVMRDGAALFEHVAVARLTMRDFSDAFLESYLDAAGDAVLASVGAYQLEKYGVHLFERIDGDHFTILGMPLMPLLGGLRAAGLLTG